MRLILGQKNWWTLIIWALEVDKGVCGSKMFMVKEYKLGEITEKLKNVEGCTNSGGLVSVIHWC